MVSSVWIEGPTVEPLPFGLFSVAQMVDDAEARFLMGARHEVDYCGEAYDTAGACFDFGTVSIEVDAAGEATVTADGFPDGEYTIVWGDDEDDTVTQDPDGATHTYADPGDYTVVISGPRSYGATITIEVVDGEASESVDGVAGVSKEPVTGITEVSAEGFSVLHMFECNPVGNGAASLEDRARRGLVLGEQRAVERVVARELSRRAGAVLLTSVVQSAADGLAKLEKYAAANYPGVPTIHVTRDVGTILTGKGYVDRYSGRLETVQGSRVASGGGYSPLRVPDPSGPIAANAEDVEYMYVTGMVQVRRSAAVDASALQPTSNTLRALAERAYTVTWDCITAAVPVSTVAAAVIDGGGA